MKLGIGLYWGGMEAEDLADIAHCADELGYDAIGLWEHLVYPKDYQSHYPYTADGKPPFLDTRSLDPWVTLSHIAAVTKRARLGTSIYILPLRNPFVSAKAIMTADVLSRGRIDVGVGVGWMEEEFKVVGENFQNRGRRMEEIIEVLRKLWTEDVPEHHGYYYDFGPVHFDPKPAQKPCPPIFIGGETEVAMRRAARIADGWMSGGTHFTPEAAGEMVKKVKGYLKEYGRENIPFPMRCGGGGWLDVDMIRRYEEAGVDQIGVSPWLGGPEFEAAAAKLGTATAAKQAQVEMGLKTLRQRIMDGLDRYAHEIFPKLGK